MIKDLTLLSPTRGKKVIIHFTYPDGRAGSTTAIQTAEGRYEGAIVPRGAAVVGIAGEAGVIRPCQVQSRQPYRGTVAKFEAPMQTVKTKDIKR